MSSYDVAQRNNQTFLGEGLNPKNTTLETLASLKAVADLYSDDQEGIQYQAVRAVAKEEARQYVMGCALIKESPELQNLLGTGTKAAKQAAALYNRYLGQQAFDKAMSNAIKGGDKSKLGIDRVDRSKLKSLIG